MVFDIARAADILGIGRAAGEFGENHAIGLAHHVGEDVEAAAVRHAEHELADAVGSSRLKLFPWRPGPRRYRHRNVQVRAVPDPGGVDACVPAIEGISTPSLCFLDAFHAIARSSTPGVPNILPPPGQDM